AAPPGAAPFVSGFCARARSTEAALRGPATTTATARSSGLDSRANLRRASAGCQERGSPGSLPDHGRRAATRGPGDRARPLVAGQAGGDLQVRADLVRERATGDAIGQRVARLVDGPGPVVRDAAPDRRRVLVRRPRRAVARAELRQLRMHEDLRVVTAR